MKILRQEFTVSYEYDVAFTEGLFAPDNGLFARQIVPEPGKPVPGVLVVLDAGMYRHHPDLFTEIRSYSLLNDCPFNVISIPVVIPGGETAKNHPEHLQQILDAVEEHDLDRHSYLAVIGGGAVIDTAGYAASIAHRGLRLIRVPTTVLAQNDAAVGVKNGINAYGKKNFLGTFDPPHAVLNDFSFLTTLEDRDWRAGISEAVKVALIKDAAFFNFLEDQADLLARRDMGAMKSLIHRCADLHLQHIATGGDPFEKGSSRPLDFGHWAAHKLEQLTNYELRHGEAVAIGIAVDATYSYLKGMLPEPDWHRILDLFSRSGFQLYVPQLEQYLDQPDREDSILQGLEEFRKHLGGELTILLLGEIGNGIEVHEVDADLYREAVIMLRTYKKEPV
ncbi:MAG: 3-dehydroquinate synthase [Balneolaceae bacterium]